MVVFRRNNPFEAYKVTYEDYASEAVVQQVMERFKVQMVDNAFQHIKKLQGSVYIIPENKLNDLLRQMNE